MPKMTETRTYANKSADDCFVAANAALPKAGFEVWKTRKIGWLVMANCEDPRGTMKANIASHPGAVVTLALSGEGVSEEALRAVAEDIFVAFEAELGQDG
jgi:hypothetical protein